MMYGMNIVIDAYKNRMNQSIHIGGRCLIITCIEERECASITYILVSFLHQMIITYNEYLLLIM